MKTIADLKLKGKRVLIRVDYNVPLNGGIVTDDFRVKASLPTIRYCLNKGASVILMSHLGRPKGEVVPELSLDPVSFCLEELLGREVLFSDDCISEDAIGLSQQMIQGEIHLLENLRFYKGKRIMILNLAKILQNMLIYISTMHLEQLIVLIPQMWVFHLL